MSKSVLCLSARTGIEQLQSNSHIWKGCVIQHLEMATRLLPSHNNCYCGYQQFYMQARCKGQFCFTLTLSPHLYAFLNKKYLTADSTAITAIEGAYWHEHKHGGLGRRIYRFFAGTYRNWNSHVTKYFYENYKVSQCVTMWLWNHCSHDSKRVTKGSKYIANFTLSTLKASLKKELCQFNHWNASAIFRGWQIDIY